MIYDWYGMGLGIIGYGYGLVWYDELDDGLALGMVWNGKDLV